MNNKNSQKRPISQSMSDPIGKTLANHMKKEKSYFAKSWPLFLIIFLLDIAEKIVSGVTEYSIIYTLISGFLPYSEYTTVGFIVLFEALKIILYFTFFFNWMKGEFSPYLFVAALLVSGLSVAASVYGAKPLVRTFSSPPKMVEASELENFYHKEIANTQKTIEKIQAESSKEIAALTVRDVKIFEKKKDKLIKKLEDLTSKRTTKNDKTLVQSDHTLTMTIGQVRWGVLFLNLLSLFCFTPAFARFIFKTIQDYDPDYYPNPDPEPTPTPKPRNSNNNPRRSSQKQPVQINKLNGHEANAHFEPVQQGKFLVEQEIVQKGISAMEAYTKTLYKRSFNSASEEARVNSKNQYLEKIEILARHNRYPHVKDGEVEFKDHRQQNQLSIA